MLMNDKSVLKKMVLYAICQLSVKKFFVGTQKFSKEPNCFIHVIKNICVEKNSKIFLELRLKYRIG